MNHRDFGMGDAPKGQAIRSSEKAVAGVSRLFESPRFGAECFLCFVPPGLFTLTACLNVPV